MKRTLLSIPLLLLCACAAVEPQLSRELHGRAGQTVVFDASKTAAPESRYLWDFGDGTRGEGKTARHTYARPGDYQATLLIKGDRKRGRAVVKVKVAPPSALSVLPKDAAIAAVLPSAKDALALWDLFAALPPFGRELEAARQELERELGFFPLDAAALSARGFDPEKGAGAALVFEGDFPVPVLAAGVVEGKAAMEWVKGVADTAGLIMKEEPYAGATLLRLYADKEEIAVLSQAKGFLIFVPALEDSGKHLSACRRALDTLKGDSLGDAEWVIRTDEGGNASLYIKGGEFMRDLSMDIGSGDLAALAGGLSSMASSLEGASISLSARKGALDARMLSWLSPEGAKRYRELAPQVPLLELDPSLSGGAVFYARGRLDPLVAARQAASGLPRDIMSDISQALLMVRSATGVDLATDIAEPLGPAVAVVVSLDAPALAALMSGSSAGQALPGEMILAYEVEDQERFSAGLDKLSATLSAFGGGFGINIARRQIGAVEAFELNLGFLSFGWGVKEGVVIFAAGPTGSTLEKGLELVNRAGLKPIPAGGQAVTGGGEQQMVVRFDLLREALSTARDQLRAAGQPDRDLEQVIYYLSAFEVLSFTTRLDGETMHTDMTLELGQ